MKSLFLCAFVLLPNTLLAQSNSPQKPQPAAPAQKAPTELWQLPESALFFVQDPQQEWYKSPPADREWLFLGGMSAKLFEVLGPTDADKAFARGEFEAVDDAEKKPALQKQALGDWGQALQVSWLPAANVVTVAHLKRKSGETSVAHCTFRKGNARVLLMGTLGQGFSLYIEQPEPINTPVIPATTAPQVLAPVLMPADVVRADLMQEVRDENGVVAFPRMKFGARSLLRYRAFLPAGPYERVRILWMHFDFPAQLNVSTFGYR